MLHNMLLVLGLFVSWSGAISSSYVSGICGGGVFFVERRFLNSWSKCPLDVATIFGRCLVINEVVSPGKVVRCLFLIARSKVDLAGFSIVAEWYWASSDLVLSNLMTPFATGVRRAP